MKIFNSLHDKIKIIQLFLYGIGLLKTKGTQGLSFKVLRELWQVCYNVIKGEEN